MNYQFVTIDGQQVETAVATAYNGRLQPAFIRAFPGLKLEITCGTRTRAEQAELYAKYRAGGTLAAAPGYSNHEVDGPVGPRAIDVHDTGADAGVTVNGSARANWMKAHAAENGFDPAGYRFSQVEPWHIEFTGTFDSSATAAPTTAQTSAAPGNPFGIPDVKGLQKIARLNGGNTTPDNIWGAESAKGFTHFLATRYGYVGNLVLGPVMWASIARWLRARWGYVGNDVPGPVMRAALQRANTANFEQLN